MSLRDLGAENRKVINNCREGGILEGTVFYYFTIEGGPMALNSYELPGNSCTYEDRKTVYLMCKSKEVK